MDIIFGEFKKWIIYKSDYWKKQDVFIDEIVESTHAHQIHANLHSDEGFGHIALYESNNIYWIEFEAVVRDYENYYKYIEFDSFPDFNNVEIEYLDFLTKSE